MATRTDSGNSSPSTNHRRPAAARPGSKAVAHADPRGPAQARTKVIWGVLALCMTAVGGVMYPLAASGEPTASGRSITPLTALSQPASIERIFDGGPGGVGGAGGGIDAPLAEERWDAIVIHHSGSPVCTAATIDQRHRAAGLMGMGYHFVIGNGRRMGDGELHIGDRWASQAPGAHVAGEAGLTLNQSAIGICLVGDGNRSEFTRPQSRRLIELVARLCERLDIPPSRVFMHRDVAHTSSPGRLFPEADLRAYLSGR